MTSEIDALKTNEIVRRRKLRLQQVREQSKDIAKKIRQRARVEKLKQVVELDTKKRRDYFNQQELLVKRLENFYDQGIENIGTSHKNASELNEGKEAVKPDPSKQRGRVAAAELRKKRQAKLDEQKKILDRKLQAREAANEASREKSATLAQKLTKTSNKEIEVQNKDIEAHNNKGTSETKTNQNNDTNCPEVKSNEMAMQWDCEPSDWEPNVPLLSLPIDDKDSAKETNNNIESKSDKSKHLDLFALSEEMPSSLRGGLTNREPRAPVKPSLTLVSEYLQNRGLRLREKHSVEPKKKNNDELHNIKQTILRSRASKPGSAGTSSEKVAKSNRASDKKNFVTMYNHTSRNTRDIHCDDDNLVVRNVHNNDDAYSLAMKVSSVENTQDNTLKKAADCRSKIAMSKHQVEKEYRDTISFLNSLPKDSGDKPIRRAFMDEDRQQLLNERRQQKLQTEYNNIVKNCKKPNCRHKTKSKSPVNNNTNDIDISDLQYSWMPVPEEDGKLAIHTIPTSFKETKTGNTVKFSKIDSYHEYRSRHKHTPPTKDTSQAPMRLTESSPQNTTSAETSESSLSEVLTLETKDNKINDTEKVSDAERIIIYKILDSKHEKKKNEKVMKNIAKSLSLLSQKTKLGNDSPKKDDKDKCRGCKGFSFEEMKEGVYEAANQNGTGDNITSMYFSKDVDEKELSEEIKDGRPCCCNKKKNTDQGRTGTTPSNPQWEIGDTSQNIRHAKKVSSSRLKCACNDDIPELATRIKPSAAPSSSSSKTTGDKNSAGLPDSGLIKLLDEASGFLKDDAYEMVIQLRKKSDEKEASESSSKVDRINVISQETNLPETAKIDENIELAEENQSDTVKDPNSSNNNVYPSQFSINHVTSINLNKKSSLESKNVKVYAEKGIGTSMQDSFTDNLLKTESSRPVTSAYTQTSLSSPSHRPVLLHMSSTTSTAYMSPPEMIVPKFMNQDFMSDEDVYVHEQLKANRNRNLYAEDDECRCLKCCHARNVACKPSTKRCRKTVTRKTFGTATPPNTVRSNLGSNMAPFMDFNKKSKRKENCSCSKCRYTNYKPPSSTQLKHTLMSEAIPSSTSSNKKDRRWNKSRLNPTIREYVNKLLQLNKASHKAIQVIDQDCSNVSTPGSSVINVPSNNNIRTIGIENRISLSQFKTILAEQIFRENGTKNMPVQTDPRYFDNDSDTIVQNMKQQRLVRKKTVHKVKSLNISKNLFKPKPAHKIPQTKDSVITDPKKEETTRSPSKYIKRNRSNSSPTPRSASSNSPTRSKTKPNIVGTSKTNLKLITAKSVEPLVGPSCHAATSTSKARIPNLSDKGTNPAFVTESSVSHHPVTTLTSKPQIPGLCDNRNNNEIPPLNIKTPSNISTQTSMNSDSNFYKFDEDKIHNMEKIADLTEKCTKRLSNLAKVLEEVRRSKSLAYSHISTSDESDQKSDKNVQNGGRATSPQSFDDSQKCVESKPTEDIESHHKSINEDSETFVPFLNDIPKPESFKVPTLDLSFSSSSSNKSNPNENHDNYIKTRAKPPPALSRIHLKHGQDYLIPHELSTVVEVDSPMSVKVKSRNDTKIENPENINQNENITYKADRQSNEKDPELSCSDVCVPPDLKNSRTVVNTETSIGSKIQMIDMNQFNEIMLKPFFSLQEYAKNNNVVSVLEDGSNIEDFAKGDVVVDEMSSLHSDASLPDVISELLKRNIISEPFKFDTGSNVHSTTLSSESSMSVLALSKMRKRDKKLGIVTKNKENAIETSDTLSISSNPDLENAFKKMGMGWASSTLKKTKERLALSSSSNTSSSSLTHFKLKSFNQDVPVLVNDSVPPAYIANKKPPSKLNPSDVSKNAAQQTSVTASRMIVKEFLKKELANKITFNKSRNRNETEEEFVSLFETKLPDDLKEASRVVREDTVDISIRSNNNRARTSTPVQLYKSMTFQSSSSSNVSNGLFSNADDLSSVKHTSNSLKNNSASEKDDLTIPNFSLRVNKNGFSE